MLRILTILVTLILQRVLSEEVINTQSDYYQMATLINLSIGSPPAPLQLQVQFGTKSQNTFGQFIIDQSFVENSYQYAEMVKNYEFKNIYNIKKSSTALSKEPFQIEDPLYHDQISGNYVSDIISYNNIQSKYQFACVTNGDMQFFYYSGVIIFDRLGQNIFDQMYKSQSIKTSDYILTGEKKTVKIYDFSYTWNQINIIFDLDQSSDYYKYPSNPMISNSDHFEIMSYGIYMDNEDVTDKLKYKKVSLDQITNYNVIEDMISIPTDLLQLIQNKYNIPEELSFRGCAKCQCQDVVNLPEITIITEQYKFSINRSQYTQGNEYDCNIYLRGQDRFILSSAILFHTNNKIMYQKSSNSIKIINGQLINHLNINYIIATFSTFSTLIMVSLVYIILNQSFNFKLSKSEEQNQKKILNQILQMKKFA
ncbi:hypothetical protein ABPG74_006796 [Tetrahymena malaccensis]